MATAFVGMDRKSPQQLAAEFSDIVGDNRKDKSSFPERMNERRDEALSCSASIGRGSHRPSERSPTVGTTRSSISIYRNMTAWRRGSRGSGKKPHPLRPFLGPRAEGSKLGKREFRNSEKISSFLCDDVEVCSGGVGRAKADLLIVRHRRARNPSHSKCATFNGHGARYL
jgi:hypothetical protein